MVASKLRKKIAWLFRRAEGALLPDRVLATEGAHLDPDGARLALRAMLDDLRAVGGEARLVDLDRALDHPEARATYADQYGLAGVTTFVTAKSRIHRIEVETFPRHVNNVYVVERAEGTILVDAGSGLPSSRRDLALGFAVLAARGERARWDAIDVCLVTHAHSDHFAGTNHLRETSRAELAAHALDAPVLSDYATRLASATAALDTFWIEAGVPEEVRLELRAMYGLTKRLFKGEPVVHVLEDGDVLRGLRVVHVPGHCPGLLCVQVDDVLLTSDHVLSRITPHQFPESVAPFAGLGHYFASLAKIRDLPGIRYALGGHEETIEDLPARVDAIRAFHERRLERTLDAFGGEARTVHEITLAMFGDQEGYGVILALDEAGAHVEHLARAGRLVATRDGAATRYQPR